VEVLINMAVDVCVVRGYWDVNVGLVIRNMKQWMCGGFN
jgi:hypothetical protein